MKSVQGLALVASPYLNDPNFLRSVVYMLRHDEEGAIGLVLNRPMHMTIGALLEQVAGEAVENDMPVYYGGPVDGPLMLLQECHHQSVHSVYVASDQQRILDICDPERQQNRPGGEFRVFDGYSGWAADQLEEELQGGGWLVWEIQPDQLFSDPEVLWQIAIKQIGLEILAGGIDPTKMPEDPAFN